jgi:hypothetical protein
MSSQGNIQPETMGPANLVFLANDRLRPVLEEMEEVESLTSTSGLFVCSELLECFLWLHLGVQIDYFPKAGARRLMYEYFPKVLKAYNAVSHATFFETAFRRSIRTIWEVEFAGRQELFSSGRSTDSSNGEAKGKSFQDALIFSNEFAIGSSTRRLSRALTLLTDADWVKELESEDPNGHWSAMGVLSTVEYMRTVRQISTRANDAELNIFRTLREIQQWRLNFADRNFRIRFRDVALTNVRLITKTATLEEADAVSVIRGFLSEVFNLMVDWGAPADSFRTEVEEVFGRGQERSAENG